MLAFCGAGDGFASVWYDSSGLGNHATQTRAASQFRVVQAGVVVKQGGWPCLGFNGSSGALTLPSGMFAGLTSSTAFCVFTQAAAVEAGWWRIGSSIDTHTPWSDGAAYEQYLATSRPGYAGYGPASAGSTTSPTVHVAQNDGTALSVFKNGTQIGAAQAITFTDNPTNRSGGGSQYGQVNLSEVIFTAAALSIANRQLIERSMGAYYGITVA